MMDDQPAHRGEAYGVRGSATSRGDSLCEDSMSREEGTRMASYRAPGGNGGVVFMGLYHTRDGYRRASLTYCDHLNAYRSNFRIRGQRAPFPWKSSVIHSSPPFLLVSASMRIQDHVKLKDRRKEGAPDQLPASTFLPLNGAVGQFPWPS